MLGVRGLGFRGFRRNGQEHGNYYKRILRCGAIVQSSLHDGQGLEEAELSSNVYALGIRHRNTVERSNEGFGLQGHCWDSVSRGRSRDKRQPARQCAVRLPMLSALEPNIRVVFIEPLLGVLCPSGRVLSRLLPSQGLSREAYNQGRESS